MIKKIKNYPVVLLCMGIIGLTTIIVHLVNSSETNLMAKTMDSSEIDSSGINSSDIDSSEADSSEVDSSEADSSEVDSSEADSSETDSSETDSSETDSSETDSSETDSSETDSSETDSSETDSSETDSSETDSSETDSSETDSSETDSSETDSSETDSSETDSSETDSSETDSSETDSSEADSSETDSSKTDSSKTDSSKDKPTGESSSSEKDHTATDKVSKPSQSDTITTAPKKDTVPKNVVSEDKNVANIAETELEDNYFFSVTKNQTTGMFINSLKKDAQEIAWKNDLYASVMIAQAILETGSGNSALSSEPNYNLFGVKGDYNKSSVTMSTQEDDGKGNLYTINSAFRKYPSYKESLEDYAVLLKDGISGNSTFYRNTWKSNAKTYRDATAFLTGRYATDTRYGQKLNALIESYQLTQYDSKPGTTNEVITKEKKTIVKKRVTSKKEIQLKDNQSPKQSMSEELDTYDDVALQQASSIRSESNKKNVNFMSRKASEIPTKTRIDF